MPGPPEESRFGFLLNPIKDLTKNWQVDLSKFLSEYLSELARTHITFDGGETVMNFAEAAMLIQGSACVYGRKVEFLWKMVLQMLELLANKKAAAKQGAKGKKGAVDPNETIGFLPMDDIPLCKKQVKEDMECKLTVKLLPVTPVCLVDKDKTMKAVPLLSTSGDLLGNKHDYRLNSTTCSVTGLLCTEMDTEALQRHHAKSTFSPTASPDLSAALASSAAAVNDPEPMDDAAPSPGPPSPVPEQQPEPEPEPEPEKRTHQRQLRRRREIAPAPVTSTTEQWKPKDLYQDCGKKRRPIRKGRITLRPACLCQTNTANKRKRKLAEPPQSSSLQAAGEPAPLPSVSEYLKWELLSPALRLTRARLKHVHPELRPELMKELERRKSQLQHIKLSKRDVSRDEKDPELVAAAEDNSDCASLPGAGGDADEFPEPAHHPVELPRAAPPDSYEGRVQQRVAEYLSAAQEYVQSTELSRRVARWQEAVLPRLEAEERRKEFNIHDYGTRILERFPEGSGKSTVPFSEVVRGEQAPEVARYLLSSLMLANTYNVEISEPSDTFDGMDSMELTLLSRRRHHEELDGYHAPSQASPRRKSQEGVSRAGTASARTSPRRLARHKKRAPRPPSTSKLT